MLAWTADKLQLQYNCGTLRKRFTKLLTQQPVLVLKRFHAQFVHKARRTPSKLMELLSHCSVPRPDAVCASGGRPGAEVQHGGAEVPRVEGGRGVHRGGRLDQGQHAPLPVAQRR